MVTSWAFSTDLDGNFVGVTLRTKSADLWHRPMGHVNRKSTDVPWQVNGTGVEYAGEGRHTMAALLGKARNKLAPSGHLTMFSDLFRSSPPISWDPFALQRLVVYLRQQDRRPSHQMQRNVHIHGKTAR